MSTFYFKPNTSKHETVLANGVDVKRLARVIRKSLPNVAGGPSITTDEALEIAARGLGAQSYFDLRRQAEDPDISTWTRDDVERLVQKSAVSQGSKFPKKLPRKFDANWQRSAENLFEQAINARTPGKLEFVALVGASGAGKTLLANHLCFAREGQVIDVELSLQRGTDALYKPGSVLVYDRPAKSPASDRPTVEALTFWHQESPAKRTLKRYRELRRIKQALIPHDEAVDLNPLRGWIRDNGHVTFVVCFADHAQVEDALRNSHIMLAATGLKDSAILNWRRAHVINLDSMTLSSLDGPGLEMEKGKYPPLS